MSQETTLDILFEYLEECRNGTQVDSEKYTHRLRRLHDSEDEIHFLLTEMDYEWTREQAMLSKSKIAKSMFQIGLITSIGIASLTIFFSLVGSWISILPYGLVAAGLLASMKGYFDMKSIKQYERRRVMKWKTWK